MGSSFTIDGSGLLIPGLLASTRNRQVEEFSRVILRVTVGGSVLTTSLPPVAKKPIAETVVDSFLFVATSVAWVHGAIEFYDAAVGIGDNRHVAPRCLST